jgi:hypothetical protein
MKREIRYLVLKLKDVQCLSQADQAALKYIAAKVDVIRMGRNKIPLACVVVESDWPEYEPTWQAIERRVDAAVEGESIPEVCTKEMDELAQAIGEDYQDDKCPVCGKGEPNVAVGKYGNLSVCEDCYKSGRLIGWLDEKVKRAEGE